MIFIMIIFIYGENHFLASRKIKELREKFINDIDKSGNSLTILEGVDTDMKQINEGASTASLLSSKRMLIIKDIFVNKSKNILEEVRDYFEKLEKLEKKDNDNIIVFQENSIKIGKKGVVKIDKTGKEKALLKKEKELFSFLSKQKFVQEFKSFNNLEYASWVKAEVEKKGGSINSRAIQTLIALVGNDLWQLDSEINKLVSFKKGKNQEMEVVSQIDVSDVENMVKGKFDEDIFALTDAISARNKKIILKILEEQYEAGLSDTYILTMIIRQVKILLQIRDALDQGQGSKQIITNLRLHPFIVQKGINQVRNFSIELLKRMLDKLLEIDYDMKTGRGEAKLLLDLMLSKL